MFLVSGPAEGNGHDEGSGSVLSNLPRTRPQRETARRTAARGSESERSSPNGASANGAPPARKKAGKPAAKRARSTASGAKAAKGGGTAPRAATSPKRGRRSAAKKPAGRAPLQAVGEEVPRQGFETEDERATGSVPPPGTADVLSTAVEALGEIAKAGIAGGERLLRDAFSRLGL